MPFTLTGAQVRELRLAVGVTQADLARHVVCTRSAVYKWERSPQKSIPSAHYQSVLDYLTKRMEAIAAQRAQAERLRAAS